MYMDFLGCGGSPPTRDRAWTRELNKTQEHSKEDVRAVNSRRVK